MVDVYTDGGCRGNPGVGAYAIISYKDGKQLLRIGDYRNSTTNNEMELAALVLALDYALVNPGEQFRIYSDSQYVVNSYNDYLDDWILTGRIDTRPNKKFWKYVYKVKSELKSKNIQVTIYKVKGHSDNAGNVEVDKYVNQLMDKREELNIQLDHPTLSYLISQSRDFSDTKIDTEVKPKVTVSSIEKESDGLVFIFTDGTNYKLPIDFDIKVLNEEGEPDEKVFIDGINN